MHSRYKTWARSATWAICLTFAGTPAAFGNLVVNPGFETGDKTGWTEVFSFFCFGSVGNIAHTGDYGYGNATPNPGCSLEQTIATQAGATYDIDFWLFGTGGTPNSFHAYWDGDLLTALIDLPLATINPAHNDFLHFTFSREATSENTVLRFDFLHDPIYWVLDDVSVVQTDGPPTGGEVPEPGSWLTAALGLGALGLARRRFRPRPRA